jgi:phosphoribosylformylglycinamidine synthase
MAFAGGTGLRVALDELGNDPLASLFSEELGAVLQVRESDLDAVLRELRGQGLGGCTTRLGAPAGDDRVVFTLGGKEILARARVELRRVWSETTHRMQALRDNAECADQEQELRCDPGDPGLGVVLPFDPSQGPSAPSVARGARPRLAILREEGVNGQVEMAAAFHRAGFECVDVHMSDLLEGRVSLAGFRGLAACGGFSYGDVLGGGEGWAKSILFHARAREEFASFFERSESFALGVCNGCQMLSNLRELIPGAERWPRFVRNLSEQFEARLCLVEIEESPSILLGGMTGARLPIVVAHGEGRAECEGEPEIVAARFVDNRGAVTEHYPENPNGSPAGITALTTRDGRVTIMMPHPERVFRTVQHSWHPDGWGEDGPWMRLFRNARLFVD